MRVALGVIGLGAIATFASVSFAQDRPDFSGRWVIGVDSAARGGRAGGAPGGGGGARGGGAAANAGRGGAGRGSLGSGWGPDITVTQDANRLTLRYELFGRGDMQPPIIYQYALDGGESKNRVLLGWGVEDRLSRTRWEGGKLIITTVFTSPDPATGAPARTEFTQALTLETPTSLVVESTRPGIAGSAPSVTRTTYTKM